MLEPLSQNIAWLRTLFLFLFLFVLLLPKTQTGANGRMPTLLPSRVSHTQRAAGAAPESGDN